MAGKPQANGRAHNFRDRTGERVGKSLTVIGIAGKVGKNLLWACQCDCGESVTISGSNLGSQLSCGCYAKTSPEVAAARAAHRGRRAPYSLVSRLLSPEERCRRKVFTDYRAGARRRGYAFQLSREEFYRLIESACHYCGARPSNYMNLTRIFKGIPYLTRGYYNGIDRKDNAHGYLTENCLPCCFRCNHAKGTMAYDEFIAWLKSAASHLSLSA